MLNLNKNFLIKFYYLTVKYYFTNLKTISFLAVKIFWRSSKDLYKSRSPKSSVKGSKKEDEKITNAKREE